MEITINSFTTGYVTGNTMEVQYPADGWDSRKQWRLDMEAAALDENDLINEEVALALESAGFELAETGHEFNEDEMTITYQIHKI